MESEEKQLKLVAKAIRENGPVPVSWDCGGDETPVIFEGWATGLSRQNDSLAKAFRALRDRIVSKLHLPNAGESSNVGEGTVSLDGGRIQLSYSLVHVAYGYCDEKLPKRFQPQTGVTAPLENYWGGDCAAYLCFRFDKTAAADDSSPAWRKEIYVTPNKSEAVIETARDYLVPFLTPIIAQAKEHMRDRSELAVDDFCLTGIDFDGRFDTANQILNYDLRHSYEFAITVDQSETVVLF